MKGLPRLRPRRYLRSLAFLCLLDLRVMSFNSIEAQEEKITNAKQLLAQKEGELRMFVNAVEANARNCDVLTGCSSSACSRLACYEYGIPGDQNYLCLPVANNTFCNVSGSAPVCMQRNFDFTKGYIRRVDPTDNHIARTVCTHRSLDDHFKSSTMNDSSHFFRVFFGAVDGTFRIYPGADEPCETNMYDPRLRPWYLESTYIPKVVTVLIDSGLNMRDTMDGTDYETYISKAITTALRVLDTLKEDSDYVTIMCFDGDGINQLMNASPVIYNKTRMYQSFSDNLTAVAASPSKSDPNSTHTNNALSVAINQLTSSSSIPATYLKVVIALIGGQQYDNITDLNVTAIPRMNLFVYSFRTPLLPQCNPALRASLEEIPKNRSSNPLYALQSYYSFLAKLHINFMNYTTDYGPLYPDFSRIDAHTLTLSKAAFGPNGELLGVMGIDFYERKVEEQFPIQFVSISNEASSHDPGSFDVAVDLSTNVCFNHTDACPGLDTANVQGFICEKNPSPDIMIGCCGSCTASKKKKSALGPAIGGGIGGLAGLILVVGFLLYCRKKRNGEHGNGVGNPDFPEYGEPREEVVSGTGSARRVRG